MFTSGFEELAAYLAQVTDRTAVSRLLGISWVTVGSIVERIVARRLDGARFAKLRRIGVDEFSYRKRHRDPRRPERVDDGSPAAARRLIMASTTRRVNGLPVSVDALEQRRPPVLEPARLGSSAGWSTRCSRPGG